MLHASERPVARGLRLVALAALFGVLGASRSAGAEQKSLAGSWSATALTVNWKIGDWGSACGPKPSGGGIPSGMATIQESGSELLISGAGRTYSTRECWEQLPGLNRTGHTAGARSWRTTCKSAAGDPRQASLVTTVTATDDQITLDETGQYQFVIQGQNCTASVRRTRFFRRLQSPAASDAGAEPAVTSPESAVPREPAPAAKAEPKVPACATTGPPSRIEVRPSRKLIRPGESFSFRAGVVDARGCALAIAPTFRGVSATPGIVVSSNGHVEVGEAAAEGEVPLLAIVGSRSVGVVLQVVSRERYDALLAEGGFDQTGASAETAVAKLESGSVGARSTVVEDDSARRRTLFVAIVGGAALVLGILGLALVRRSRKRAATLPDSRRVPAAGRSPRPARPMICPTCRDEFPPEAQFCPVDGNRLVPLEAGVGVGPAGAVCPVCGQGFDPGVSTCPKHDEPLVPPAVHAVARAGARPEIQKICPVCGTQFTGESQFCGRCGAALVQVN